MTKTISQKLRELAFKHDSWNWRQADFDLCWDMLPEWRDFRTETLDDLTPNEWFDFCNLVACALESEQ